jgi:putative SOS response-associated peptidase YedK
MCGRFTNRLTWREIVALYRLSVPSTPDRNLPARYNICPTDKSCICTYGLRPMNFVPRPENHQRNHVRYGTKQTSVCMGYKFPLEVKRAFIGPEGYVCF